MPTVKHQPKRYFSAGLLLTLLLVLLSACGSATPAATTNNTEDCLKLSVKELRLGVIPAENTQKVLDASAPFKEELEKQFCDTKVTITVGTSYSATITAMSSNKLEVGWFGPFSYVLASDKYNAEAILRQLTVSGQDHYFSYIITTPQTGIKTIADLKDRSFAFVDPASTSGNLVPRYTLTKNGLNPDTDVKGIFAGSHDLSMTAVLSGKADAGAIASDTYEKLLKEGKFKEGDFVIVAKSDAIPSSPIAAREDLSQSDKDAIKEAFLAIKNKEALEAMGSGGFKEDNDSSYNPLRDIAKTLNLDLTKLK